MRIAVKDAHSPVGASLLQRLAARGATALDEEVLSDAEDIVGSVRQGGDQALLEAVRRFDGLPEVDCVEDLRLGTPVADTAPELAPKLGAAIEESIRAVRQFYSPQVPQTHRSQRQGATLEERWIPFRRVGLYVPGGRFPYPSTVIMSAVPARLAGAREIVVVTPPLAYRRSAALRHAIEVLGIDEVWGFGGAHAIAALAYGTESIRPVECIVGPGNVWVTAAKRLVARDVAIDQEAGPSEVVVIASAGAPAEWIAADLLAQAEHDPAAMAVLLTPDRALADAVSKSLEQQLQGLDTREVAQLSLERRGGILVTQSLEEAVELAEQIAPEHLQLMGEEAERLVDRVRCSGAVFVGASTPTVFGDYLAGPSHVLPTGGTARFSSGLGVQDFGRYQHVARFDASRASRAGELAAAFAAEEGLVAHARAAALRAEPLDTDAQQKESQPSPARFVRPELRDLSEYSLHQVPFTHKLDQNEVPWDLPRRLKQQALQRLSERNWAHYPDFHSERLRALLAERHAWPHDGVLVGNGSNELLGLALDAIVGHDTEVLGALPTFGLYEMFVRRAGGRSHFLPPRCDLQLPYDELLREIDRDAHRPLILCTPNNPTGSSLDVEQVGELASRIEAPLLLDNAYGEFCRHDYRPLLRQHRHLMLFGTFSKAWSLAGIRLGYVLADPDLVRELIKIKLPYNVGHATATLGELVLEQPRWGERSARLLVGLREKWRRMLEGVGLEVLPSEGNFLLVRHADMERIRLELAQQGILIRKMSHYPGLSDCARVAVGNARALRDTQRVLEEIV